MAEGPRRARARRVLLRIAAASLVVLLALLGLMGAGRVVYDSDLRYENLGEYPTVWTAVPVGTDDSAVVYFEYGHWNVPPAGYSTMFYVAFLDERGRYINQPTELEGVHLGTQQDGMDGANSAVHGTTEGVAIIHKYMDPSNGWNMSLRCTRVDALTGAVEPWMEPIPWFNSSRMEFQSVQWGDTIHLVGWRSYAWNDRDTSPVLYLRSTDGGRSWSESRLLLDTNVTVSWASLVVRGDIVSVVLLGVHGMGAEWNEAVDLLVQSRYEGASFGQALELHGNEVPDALRWSKAAQGADGTVLLNTYTSTESGVHSEIFIIAPYGAVECVSAGDQDWVSTVDLVLDEDYPRYYLGDVYNVLSANAVDRTMRFDTYDLEGGLVVTKTLTHSEYRMYQGLWYTRGGDGKLIGVSTEYRYTGHGDCPDVSKELVLVEEDVVTGEKTTIGKPYEVVDGHTEAEETAYAGRVRTLIAASWVALVALLASALLASRFEERAPDKAAALRWSRGLFVSMAVLTTACLATAVYVDSHHPRWVFHPNFYGLLYVVAGVHMVEMNARLAGRVPIPRAHHVVFAVLGALLVFIYAAADSLDVGYYAVLMVLLSLIAWPILIHRSIRIPRRFLELDMPVEYRWSRLALRVGFIPLTLLFILLPMLVFVGSYHVYQ